MAPRKNAKGGGSNSSSGGSSGSGSQGSGTSGGGSSSSSSSSSGIRRETKHGGHKNGRKGGLSGSSFFTWFMVIALLGVWTSVAVVWFDLVDYEEVLGKLGVYDADGDGDFDVDDAKVLLGLKERPTSEPAAPPGETDPDPWLEEQVPKRPEPEHTDDDLQEQILSHLHETVHAEHGKQLQQEEDGPTEELQLEDSFMEGSDTDDRFETLETGTFHEEAEDSYHVEDTAPQDYTQGMEDIVYPQENLDSIEPAVEDGGRMSNDADDITYQDYDDQVYELPEHERRQASDNAIDDSHILLEDLPVSPAEEPDT